MENNCTLLYQTADVEEAQHLLINVIAAARCRDGSNGLWGYFLFQGKKVLPV